MRIRTTDIREKILQNLLVVNNYCSIFLKEFLNERALEQAIYIGRFARTFSY